MIDISNADPAQFVHLSRRTLWGPNPIGKRFAGCIAGRLARVQTALIRLAPGASRRPSGASVSAIVAPMPDVPAINDVIVKELVVHGDHRGRVMEGWREEWTPFTVRQLTEGRAQAGVLKGLHLHYKQWDWWRIVTGRMLVALYDARPHSETFGTTMTLELNTEAPAAVGIPPGVAHGYYALEDLEMIYLLSEVYDPSDEFGVRWDSVGIEWPYIAEGRDPIVSERDINLPTAAEFEFKDPAS